MPASFEYLRELFLLTARHSMVLALVPAFGMRALPVPTRIALAVLLSTAVLPWGGGRASGIPADYGFFVALGTELLVGGLMGLGVLFVFAALQAAGALVDTQLGLGIASLVDPASGVRDTPTAVFYNLVAGVVFFAGNGHHQLILAMRSLLDLLPPGVWSLSPAAVESLLDLAGAMFSVAVRIALPAAGALLVADMALGLASRLVPQIQPLLVGVPVKVALGLAILVLGMPLWVSLVSGLMAAAPFNATLPLLAGRP